MAGQIQDLEDSGSMKPSFGGLKKKGGFKPFTAKMQGKALRKGKGKMKGEDKGKQKGKRPFPFPPRR